MTLAPLLSIPSPSDPLIAELGPLKLRWYGTLIALGIVLAGWLAGRELERRGYPPAAPTRSRSGASRAASSAPACTTW